MVQIIENRAVIAGDLLAIEPDPARPGMVILRVAVREAHAIDDIPNFFADDVGRTIALMARRDGPAAALPAGPVRLRARKTGPDASFAEDVAR